MARFEKPFTEATRSKSKCKHSNNSINVLSSKQETLRSFLSPCLNLPKRCSPLAIRVLNLRLSGNGLRPIVWQDLLHFNPSLFLVSPWDSHRCLSPLPRCQHHRANLDMHMVPREPNPLLHYRLPCLFSRLPVLPFRTVK